MSKKNSIDDIPDQELGALDPAEVQTEILSIKVLMYRDGWLVDGTRCPTGTEVFIPEDIARFWIQGGACCEVMDVAI